MGKVAAAVIPGILGGVAGMSDARRQEKYAMAALEPRPYSSETTQGPPAWLLPFIQEAAGEAQASYQNRRDNPRLPPTFNDITSGRYGSPLPTSAVGGIQPGNVSPRIRAAWDAREANGERLNDRQRQRIAERVIARDAARNPAGSPGGGRQPSRTGGGGGGGGRGSSDSSAVRQFSDYILGRAQREVPGQRAGLDFVSSLLGRGGPDTSALQQGIAQQMQTYNDFRSPGSPVNQLIQRGVSGGGYSSAAPMQRELAQQLMYGMNAPPTPLPTNRFQSYFDLAGGPDFRFFTP